jgi:hypothetical protein
VPFMPSQRGLAESLNKDQQRWPPCPVLRSHPQTHLADKLSIQPSLKSIKNKNICKTISKE